MNPILSKAYIDRMEQESDLNRIRFLVHHAAWTPVVGEVAKIGDNAHPRRAPKFGCSCCKSQESDKGDSL